MKSKPNPQAGIPHFQSPLLLNLAFVHRSYLNEQKKNRQSNERLEYLGDAVLELIVSEYLYRSHAKLTEGRLTHLRAQIVQTQTLAWAARKLDLGKHLLLSKGERQANGNLNPSILADTYEALVGAVYLDSGYKKTQEFVTASLIKPFFANIKALAPVDYKSVLQEVVQSYQWPTPTYRVIEESGPDHNKLFKVAVTIGPNKTAVGTGQSKQKAEQSAAKNALEKKIKKSYTS